MGGDIAGPLYPEAGCRNGKIQEDAFLTCMLYLFMSFGCLGGGGIAGGGNGNIDFVHLFKYLSLFVVVERGGGGGGRQSKTPPPLYPLLSLF